MCGIVGVFNHREHSVKAAVALEILQARGADGQGLVEVCNGQGTMGHVLHAMNNHVAQPLRGLGTLSYNGELYNYKDLGKGNDTEVLLGLLDNCSMDEESVVALLDSLNGDYAFVYEREGKVVFTRDSMGVKPLWYSPQEGLALASERKALLKAGYDVIIDLNPRRIGCYDVHDERLDFWDKGFYKPLVQSHKSLSECAQVVKDLFCESVRKRLAPCGMKTAVLFSGGVDSLLLAVCLKQLGADVMCYTAHVKHPQGEAAHDYKVSVELAKQYGLELTVIGVDEDRIPVLARTVTEEVEEAHAVKVAVGMPFFVCAQAAALDGCKVIFSGLGAEELYAGYKRHADSFDVNDECLSGLLWMYERDLYRDDVLTMRQGVELRVPFLDKELIRHALSIPSEYKLSGKLNKLVLREAAVLMGLEHKDAFRPKKAAQYGSKFDWALQKTARKEARNRVEYLKRFVDGANRKLGVLCSGGKDSWYAAYVMSQQNYELSCLLVMNSQNPDSYMFHTPAIELVSLQGEAARIAVVSEQTRGEKEDELVDLKRLLSRAMKEYGIEGVVSGALYSVYQRERIEAACLELGLKSYTPLWHIGQASEVQELISNGFDVVLSAVAGEGMSAAWLGRRLDKKAVEELLVLEKRLGFHVAGEGGEYETLVLDCPLFERKLCVESQHDMENEHTGRLRIVKAWLEKK